MRGLEFWALNVKTLFVIPPYPPQFSLLAEAPLARPFLYSCFLSMPCSLLTNKHSVYHDAPTAVFHCTSICSPNTTCRISPRRSLIDLSKCANFTFSSLSSNRVDCVVLLLIGLCVTVLRARHFPCKWKPDICPGRSSWPTVDQKAAAWSNPIESVVWARLTNTRQKLPEGHSGWGRDDNLQLSNPTKITLFAPSPNLWLQQFSVTFQHGLRTRSKATWWWIES